MVFRGQIRQFPGMKPSPRTPFLPAARAFAAEFLGYAGRRAIWAAVAVSFGALLESAGLLLIIPLLGIVMADGAGSGRLAAIARLFARHGIVTPPARLAVLLAGFIVVMALRMIVVSYRDVTLARLQIGFVERQRSGIVERLALCEWDSLSRLRHARITHVISGDVQRIGTAAHFLLQAGVALVLLSAQCVLAFLLSPPLAAVSFVLLVMGAVAIMPMMRRARALGEYLTSANLDLLNATAQFLGGLKLAVSQNLQRAFMREFQETLGQMKERQIANLRQNTNSRLAMQTVSALVAAVLVYAGFSLFHVATPVLITLLLIIGRMTGPANQIQQGAQQFANALPAYEKVKELARELDQARSATSDLSPPPLPRGAVVFDHVSFSHAAETDSDRAAGVTELSATIEDGAFVGLVGASGAGKTTFADLLVALLTPQSGEIRVSGHPLEGETVAAWRSSISYVSQDPFLFHDTIRRNLGWANPRASETEMWDALTTAGAAEIVRRMPQGLDSIVGERGTLVSGGERQRIALARALLRKPQLLILDEATNAIDIGGERAILDRLAAFPERPTIVMIAHRPESLARCDRVLHLDAGRLVEAESQHTQVPQKV